MKYINRYRIVIVFISSIILLSSCNRIEPSVENNGGSEAKSEPCGLEVNTENNEIKLQPMLKLNDDIFKDFDLTYEKMARKYNKIIVGDFWQGGYYFVHEKSTGLYFYEVDYSDLNTAIKDIHIKSDARYYSAHFKAESLFLDMQAELTFKQLKEMIDFDDYEIEELEYEVGYYNGTDGNHVLRFVYGDFDLLIGCDENGTIKKKSTVIITKSDITEMLWKNIEPVKMINDKPLYINFYEDVPQYKSWETNVIEVGNKEDVSRILIYSASVLTDFQLFRVSFNTTENFEYSKEEVLLSLDKLTPNTVIILTTLLPDVADANGMAFTDSDGNRHMYTFGDNGKDTSFHLSDEPKITIGNNKRENLKNGTFEENKSQNIVTFDDKIISSLFGRSSNEVINVMGTPTGQDKTDNGTLYRMDYDGIHFFFDDDKVAMIELYSFGKLGIDGFSMNKNSNEIMNVLGEPSDETWGVGLFGTENAYMMTYDILSCSIIFEFHGRENEPPALIYIFGNNKSDSIYSGENEKSFTVNKINSDEKIIVIYDEDTDCLITQDINDKTIVFDIAKEGYVIGGYGLGQAWKTIERVADESGSILLKLEIGSVIDRWIANPDRACSNVIEAYIQFDGSEFIVVDELSFKLEVDHEDNSWKYGILLNDIPLEKIDDFNKYRSVDDVVTNLLMY